MKTLTIDIRPIVSSIHRQWDGEGTFNKHLNKKATKNFIISTLENIMNESFENAQWKINNKDREVKLFIEWDEKENINVWNTEINNKLNNATHNLIQKDLISYKV